MTRHFFEHEQMPGRPVELAFNREMLPTITLDELNHLARTWGSDHGRVVAVSGPAKAKLPTEAQIRAQITKATTRRRSRRGPTRRRQAAARRRSRRPARSSATATDAAAGTTTWTLSNGVRVVVKPTTFQNDEISFSGWQLGGSSLVADKDYVQARYAGEIVGQSGAGDHDPIALEQAARRQGRRRRTSSISEQTQDISGRARPADLETALQLAYLRVTQPRIDERAYASWKVDSSSGSRTARSCPRRASSTR